MHTFIHTRSIYTQHFGVQYTCIYWQCQYILYLCMVTVSIHSSLCDNENPTTHSISMKLATRGFRETVNRLTVQLVQTQSQIVQDSRGSTLHAAKFATEAQRFLSTCPGSSRSWYQTGQPRSPSWTYLVFVVSVFQPMPPSPCSQKGSCKCFLCSTGDTPWLPSFRMMCSQPDKWPRGSHVSCLGSGKPRHPMRNSRLLFLFRRLSFTLSTQYCDLSLLDSSNMFTLVRIAVDLTPADTDMSLKYFPPTSSETVLPLLPLTPSCICQFPNLINYHQQTLQYQQLVDSTMVLSTVGWYVKVLINSW
jgi:hypothetical protein